MVIFQITMISFGAQATTWQVGPSRQHTLPSQVSTLVADGDTVEIDAGTYESDVAKWTAHDLVLRGVGGLAHLKANGSAYGGKAIWVIAGDRATVEHIEFSGCSVPDHNGAGIRQEGHHLTVRHCYFHDNEDGILAGTLNPSTILIEHTEFGRHGYGDGLSHNVYINNIDTLIFRYNYVHHCDVGHELKSRARVNFILYNRIGNEATGTGSRNIDLPNGGPAYLIGNLIEQGPLSENHNMVGYGLEGLSNPGPHECYAVNNTLLNNYPGGSFFQFHAEAALFKAWNNIAAGLGSFIGGSLPAALDTAANLLNAAPLSLAFADAQQYDLRLTEASLPALDISLDPGTANGFPLLPDMVYEHPLGAAPRCLNGSPDIGAYELCGTSAVGEEALAERPKIFPNPAGEVLNVVFPNAQECSVEIFSLLGQPLLRSGSATMDVSGLAAGVYLLRVRQGGRAWVMKVVKVWR